MKTMGKTMEDLKATESAGEGQRPNGQRLKEMENFKEALGGSRVQPYLFFGGRCEEALEFYKQRLGATIGMVMRFNQSPDPVPEGLLQPGFESKIMHSDFTIGKTTVMASDGCNEASSINGFRLVLTVGSADAAAYAFNAFADGGNIDMPLGPIFWSPSYGQVTDRFGVGWMVMVPGPH